MSIALQLSSFITNHENIDYERRSVNKNVFSKARVRFQDLNSRNWCKTGKLVSQSIISNENFVSKSTSKRVVSSFPRVFKRYLFKWDFNPRIRVRVGKDMGPGFDGATDMSITGWGSGQNRNGSGGGGAGGDSGGNQDPVGDDHDRYTGLEWFWWLRWQLFAYARKLIIGRYYGGDYACPLEAVVATVATEILRPIVDPIVDFIMEPIMITIGAIVVFPWVLLLLMNSYELMLLHAVLMALVLALIVAVVVAFLWWLHRRRQDHTPTCDGKDDISESD